jgi:hypothetical protein
MARPWKHPKTGIYWLRRAVPADLRAAVGKREEKASLKTRDPALAKQLHAAAMVALEERWANLRTPARRFENGQLQDITVLAYKACLREENTPGIYWDISLTLSRASESSRRSCADGCGRIWSPGYGCRNGDIEMRGTTCGWRSRLCANCRRCSPPDSGHSTALQSIGRRAFEWPRRRSSIC